MELWLEQFSKCVVPQMTDAELASLAECIADGGFRLCQRATVLQPVPSTYRCDRVIAACPAVYGWWAQNPDATPPAVRKEFYRRAEEAAAMKDDRSGMDDFCEWWDTGDKSEVLASLRAAVLAACDERGI